MASGIGYLLYFVTDKTFSVVPKRSISKLTELSNKKFAHGGYGEKAYVGQVICEGDVKSIHKLMKQKKLTKSLAEETDSEKDHISKSIILIYLN
jgi:hypothetical protein